MRASFWGREAVVRCLVEMGVDVDQVNRVYYSNFILFWLIGDPGQDGKTALMIASKQGRQPVVQILVEKGASLDVADKVG